MEPDGVSWRAAAIPPDEERSHLRTRSFHTFEPVPTRMHVICIPPVILFEIRGHFSQVLHLISESLCQLLFHVLLTSLFRHAQRT